MPNCLAATLGLSEEEEILSVCWLFCSSGERGLSHLSVCPRALTSFRFSHLTLFNTWVFRDSEMRMASSFYISWDKRGQEVGTKEGEIFGELIISVSYTVVFTSGRLLIRAVQNSHPMKAGRKWVRERRGWQSELILERLILVDSFVNSPVKTQSKRLLQTFLKSPKTDRVQSNSPDYAFDLWLTSPNLFK